MESVKTGSLFESIRTGARVIYPIADAEKEYESIFTKMEEDDIMERSRRAAAYAEASNIYLTF